MAAPTMTTEQANRLFQQSQLILEGKYIVTTRTASYQWDPNQGIYERIADSLEVAHRPGVRWHKNKKHFVVCTCRWCDDHGLLVAETEIVCTKDIA